MQHYVGKNTHACYVIICKVDIVNYNQIESFS